MHYNDIDIIDIISCLRAAGDAIISVYKQPITIDTKADLSPVTIADLRSNDIITSFLSEKYPDIPIISEESQETSYAERRYWRRVWILDPLDGTREFINHSDDFCINLALIEDGRPTLGLMYLPVTRKTYWGTPSQGAFRLLDEEITQIYASNIAASAKNLRVPVSKNHLDQSTLDHIDTLSDPILIPLGSALKFLYIADGRADYYPRLAHIMEWDVAAGHAIIAAAGGNVLEYLTSQPLTYNKQNLRNPYFIAIGSSCL
jgi:3'(2'), 5'-bisphosphate nucleotidase